MYSARNRNAMITDDTFQIQDWLRSNGNHDRGGYREFDYHDQHHHHLHHHLHHQQQQQQQQQQHRIRPLSPVKRHRISIADGRGPDRRRQLRSMESLLGLSDENLNGKHLNSEVVTRASPDVQDSLDRALMDFEETLELAFQSNSIVPPPRGFSNHNLVEGDESNFSKLDSSFESHTTTGSSGYSTKPEQSIHRSTNTYSELQLIREQMVKSLEIIKDLEEQVKMVPKLKAQVSSLNLEKQRLSSELDKHKKMENANKNITGAGDWRSSTLPPNRRPAVAATAVSTRDVGVHFAPMCRDVGVTTPAAASATTGPAAVPATAAAYTQTPAPAADAKPATADAGTQSPRPAAVRTSAVGVSARPRTYDACVTARPTVKHAGCSADLSAGHRDEKVVTAAPAPAPAAVAPVTRTTQTDAVAPMTRTTQTDAVAPMTRTTQTDPVAAPAVYARGTQTTAVPEDRPQPQPPTPDRHNRCTQTDVAAVAAVAVAAADEDRTPAAGRPVAATIGRRSNSFHHYTTAAVAKDSPAASSKIPRLKPATPEFNRKVLIRQDTYTMATADENGRERQQRTSPPVDRDRVKTKEPLPSTPEDHNGLPESDINFKPIQNDLSKDNPSKEMRGALKVLNDSLKKTSVTLLPRAQLKQAIDIVREEWFKVASSSECGNHLVKNYVHWFTSYSPVLLEFIINMTDAAGNTVLHYAISHGNFDIVSTIMDTEVCNVNLMNDAGYSSVMLVSLAEIKNDQEMKIIKRLFQYGDVNLQAKKHGQTTLMLAVSHGKIEVVKLLLECGADLNVQDEDGSTALMCAAEHGLQEIVNILLSCPECDVSTADNDGSTALSIAMDAGHKEIGIALYAKQHILSRESSPFNMSKTKRSRSANTVMPSTTSYSLKKSSSLQPREYATLSSMLKTRIPQ